MDVQVRFTDSVEPAPTPQAQETVMPQPTPGQPQDNDIPVGEHHIRHPVDGKPMTLVDAGIFFAGADNEPGVLHRRLPDHERRLRPLHRRHRRDTAPTLGRRSTGTPRPSLTEFA